MDAYSHLIDEKHIQNRVDEQMAPYLNAVSSKKIDEYFSSGQMIKDMDLLLREGLDELVDGLNQTDSSKILGNMLKEIYGDDYEKHKDEIEKLSQSQGDELRKDLDKFFALYSKVQRGTEQEKEEINNKYSNWIEVLDNSVKMDLDDSTLEIIIEDDIFMNFQEKESGIIDSRLMLEPQELMVVRRVMKIAFEQLSHFAEGGDAKERFERLYNKLYKKIKSECAPYAAPIMKRDKVNMENELRKQLDDVHKVVSNLEKLGSSNTESFDDLTAKDIRENFIKTKEFEQAKIEYEEEKQKNKEEETSNIPLVLEHYIQDLDDDNLNYFFTNLDRMTYDQVKEFFTQIKSIINTLNAKSVETILIFIKENEATDHPDEIVNMMLEVYEKISMLVVSGHFDIKTTFKMQRTISPNLPDLESFMRKTITDNSTETLSEEEIEQKMTEAYNLSKEESGENLKNMEQQSDEIAKEIMQTWDPREDLENILSNKNLSIHNENLNADMEQVQVALAELLTQKVSDYIGQE